MRTPGVTALCYVPNVKCATNLSLPLALGPWEVAADHGWLLAPKGVAMMHRASSGKASCHGCPDKPPLEAVLPLVPPQWPGEQQPVFWEVGGDCQWTDPCPFPLRLEVWLLGE